MLAVKEARKQTSKNQENRQVRKQESKLQHVLTKQIEKKVTNYQSMCYYVTRTPRKRIAKMLGIKLARKHESMLVRKKENSQANCNNGCSKERKKAHKEKQENKCKTENASTQKGR